MRHRFDDERWGFFDGEQPERDDIDSYFTRESFIQMFNSDVYLSDDDFAEMRRQAHEWMEKHEART